MHSKININVGIKKGSSDYELMLKEYFDNQLK